MSYSRRMLLTTAAFSGLSASIGAAVPALATNVGSDDGRVFISHAPSTQRYGWIKPVAKAIWQGLVKIKNSKYVERFKRIIVNAMREIGRGVYMEVINYFTKLVVEKLKTIWTDVKSVTVKWREDLGKYECQCKRLFSPWSYFVYYQPACRC